MARTPRLAGGYPGSPRRREASGTLPLRRNPRRAIRRSRAGRRLHAGEQVDLRRHRDQRPVHRLRARAPGPSVLTDPHPRGTWRFALSGYPSSRVWPAGRPSGRCRSQMDGLLDAASEPSWCRDRSTRQKPDSGGGNSTRAGPGSVPLRPRTKNPAAGGARSRSTSPCTPVLHPLRRYGRRT